MNNLKADDVSGDTPGKFDRGGGGAVWLLFWRPTTISDPIYAIFPIPFHFLNQCYREKMKNKQTKNKTKTNPSQTF